MTSLQYIQNKLATDKQLATIDICIVYCIQKLATDDILTVYI